MTEEATDYSLKKEGPWEIKIDTREIKKRKYNFSAEPIRNVKAKVWTPECTLPPKIKSSQNLDLTAKSKPIVPEENNVVHDLSKPQNSIVKTKLPTPLKEKDKKKLIRMYKHTLRDEEMKLLLLKKVYLSQMVKENMYQPIVQPQPLVDKKSLLQQPNNKPLMPVGSKPNTTLLQNKPGLTPKSLALKDVPAYKPVAAHSNSQKMTTQIQKSSKTWNPLVVPSVTMSTTMIENNQRQDGAKLALRKQLEETLLKIPIPKAPIPELHFIPNPNNQEFICLVGLEWIVELLTQKNSISNKRVEPFRCSQCHTDFSAKWKWHKSPTSHMSVICESCATSNSKESVKVEHTTRLKSAFMKVLQQEYEIDKIEKSMASGSVSSHRRHHNSGNVSSKSSHRSSSKTSSHHSKSSSVHVNSKMANQSMLQTPAHHIQQQMVAAAAAAARPQPAHLLSYAPYLQAQSYSNYHRHYLLDMLNPNPSSRSTTSTGNHRHNWKS